MSLFRFEPPASLMQVVSTAYLSSLFIVATTQSISSRSTQIVPFPPTLNALVASYSSSTTIQTFCRATTLYSVGSTLLTHGFPLSLQEGEPSANDPIHGAVHIVTLGTYSIFVKQVKEQYPRQRTVRERGLDECQEVKAGEGFHYGMCSRGIKGRP